MINLISKRVERIGDRPKGNHKLDRGEGLNGHGSDLSIRWSLSGQSQRDNGYNRGNGDWHWCSWLHGHSQDCGKLQRVSDILEEDDKNRVDWSECNDREHSRNFYNRSRLSSWRFDTNQAEAGPAGSREGMQKNLQYKAASGGAITQDMGIGLQGQNLQGQERGCKKICSTRQP